MNACNSGLKAGRRTDPPCCCGLSGRGNGRGAEPKRRRAQRGSVPEVAKILAPEQAEQCNAGKPRPDRLLRGLPPPSPFQLQPSFLSLACLSRRLVLHRRFTAAAPAITAKWSIRDLGLGVRAGIGLGSTLERAISCGNRHGCRYPFRALENTVKRPTLSQCPR